MTKTIWKYVLIPEKLTISIPEGATVLTAREQGNEICIWAEVYTEKPLETRTFEIYGTGHNLSTGMGIDRQYIGTAVLHGGSLILHVYERLN
jgi:hypothetical protein